MYVFHMTTFEFIYMFEFSAQVKWNLILVPDRKAWWTQGEHIKLAGVQSFSEKRRNVRPWALNPFSPKLKITEACGDGQGGCQGQERIIRSLWWNFQGERKSWTWDHFQPAIWHRPASQSSGHVKETGAFLTGKQKGSTKKGAHFTLPDPALICTISPAGAPRDTHIGPCSVMPHPSSLDHLTSVFTSMGNVQPSSPLLFSAPQNFLLCGTPVPGIATGPHWLVDCYARDITWLWWPVTENQQGKVEHDAIEATQA